MGNAGFNGGLMCKQNTHIFVGLRGQVRGQTGA